MLQRGKCTNLEGRNSTGLPAMRIHCRRIRYLVDCCNKQQQTEQACNHAPEFHIALK
jgi:hypothetical protein